MTSNSLFAIRFYIFFQQSKALLGMFTPVFAGDKMSSPSSWAVEMEEDPQDPDDYIMASVTTPQDGMAVDDVAQDNQSMQQQPPTTSTPQSYGTDGRPLQAGEPADAVGGDVTVSEVVTVRAQDNQRISDLEAQIRVLTNRIQAVEDDFAQWRRENGSGSSHTPGASSSNQAPVPTTLGQNTLNNPDEGEDQGLRRDRAGHGTRLIRLRELNPLPEGEYCQSCHFRWSNEDRQTNFVFDENGFEGIMTQMFLDWTRQKMRNRDSCYVLNSYMNMPDRVAQSLHSFGLIGANDHIATASRLRANLWQPDVDNDGRHLTLYFGGGRSKWLSIACIRCQRGTDLYYEEANFMQTLGQYFWRAG